MQISIRRLGAVDYAAYTELLDEVDRLHREHLPHLFREPEGAARTDAYYHDLLDDPAACVLGAECEGRLAGVVQAYCREIAAPSIRVPGKIALVDTLIVSRSYRRHGIGRALMEAIHEWASANGARRLELKVYEFNQEAFAFYHELGYETLARTLSLDL